MALQGYCSSSNSANATYRLAVDKAITKKGYYAKTLSEYAQKYEMYVIFGASEKIPATENPEALDQAYNSAFCCSPDGSIVSYQKIQPVEGSWCMRGKTPVIVNTEFGGIGLSICKDTYSYPELERYYAAKGCIYIANPTATSRGGAARWSWYYSRRLESIVDRDKMVVISADLCGTQNDVDGNQHSTFPGGSCIIAPLRSAVNGSYVDYVAGSSEYNPEAVGLYVGTLNLKAKKYSIGFSIAGFNPTLYSKMYGVLAGKVSIEDLENPAEEATTIEETTTIAEEITTLPEETTIITEESTTLPEETTTMAVTLTKETTTVAEQATTGSKEATTVGLNNNKPSKVRKLTLKNSKKRAVVVKYKKAKSAKKYMIQYAMNKKFKNAKSKTIRNMTYTIKRLKKGKTYWVRVCAINGNKRGAWSVVKKIKIK